MWFARALLLASAIARLLSAGAPLDPELLTRFKTQIAYDLARVPDYTCLEMTERFQRHLGSNPFILQDTVRLEVSHVGGKDLAAKQGASNFGDTDARGLVPDGFMGTGMFAEFVRKVFLARAGVFRYHGEEKREGHQLIRYDFQMPQASNSFSIMTSSGSAMLAAKGSFWFDPVSLNLVRLVGSGEQIPTHLHVSRVVVQIDYARVPIGAGEALLPKRAELEMTYSSSEARRNITTFSGCRQYGSESTIHFDTAPATTPETPKP